MRCFRRKSWAWRKYIEGVDKIVINFRCDIGMYLNAAGLDEDTGNSSSVYEAEEKGSKSTRYFGQYGA